MSKTVAILHKKEDTKMDPVLLHTGDLEKRSHLLHIFFFYFIIKILKILHIIKEQHKV